MAASPAQVASAFPPKSKRPLSQRRIEANRRNAMRSTGPRTPEGKARVARNGIKHGIFAAQSHWQDTDRGRFRELRQSLAAEFKPANAREQRCAVTIAAGFVRMDIIERYENDEAQRAHAEETREIEERIAGAGPDEAKRLIGYRETLIRAGLWGPTIPDERAARAILRYEATIMRAVWRAIDELHRLREQRIAGESGADSPAAKIARLRRRLDETDAGPEQSENYKANPSRALGCGAAGENYKANPIRRKSRRRILPVPARLA